MSTETMKLIWVGEPGTATSIFTQLLSSEGLSSMLLYVHMDCADYQGRGAQDGHLDFHTSHYSM